MYPSLDLNRGALRMYREKVSVWLAVSFVASFISLMLTGVFNHFGTSIPTQSPEEKAAWEEFHREYPEKDVYTREEFDERGREIERINNQYKGMRTNVDVSNGSEELFLKETVLRSLRINWIVWLILPLVLRLPIRSTLAISVFPITFSWVGVFYYFEMVTFLGAYFCGAAITSSRRLLADKRGGD